MESEDSSSRPNSGPGWSPPAAEEIDALLDSYEVTEMIGRGGMGAVYKGIQTSLERLVAIKILPPEFAKQIDFAERFRREALAMARLEHPNVVHIYDYGEEDGVYFLVMEFVAGTDLQLLIRGGDLDASEALNVVGQICEALQYAHDRGYLHRDIKPANILVSQEGVVKVGDFGLAKLMDEEERAEMPSLTQSGYRLGTPQYMAPEVQRAEESKIDHRADIYSLGVMFYEMLTGSLPQGAFLPPSKTAAVHSSLDKVVLKAMRPEPADRYASAANLKTDVDKVSVVTKAKPAAAEKLRLVPFLAIGALALLAVIGFWTFGKSGDSSATSVEKNWLEDFDPAPHTIKGAWQFVGDDLISLQDESMLQFPYYLGESFDLHFEFTMVEEGRAIILEIPYRDRVLNIEPYIMWSGDRYRGGLGLLDQEIMFAPGRNGLTEVNPFVIGKRQQVAIQVRSTGDVVDVRVLADGEPHFDWKGDVNRIRGWEEGDPLLRLPNGRLEEDLGPTLRLRGGKFLVHEIRAVTGPELQQLPKRESESQTQIITAEDGWIRMNELIDLEADTLVGIWTRDESGVIRNPDSDNFVRLTLPIRIRGSYEIRTLFTHLPTDPNYHGWKLPISTGAIGFKIQEEQSRWVHGLFVTDQQFSPLEQLYVQIDELTTARIRVIESDGELTVSSELNGKETISWTGETLSVHTIPRDEPNSGYFGPGDADRPMLAVRKGEVDFESIEIRMLDGEADLLRSTPTKPSTADVPSDGSGTVGSSEEVLAWLRELEDVKVRVKQGNYIDLIDAADIPDAGKVFSIEGYASNITDERLSQFQHFEQLHQISFDQTPLTGVGFRNLRHLPLDQVMVLRSPITEEGVLAITSLPLLERAGFRDIESPHLVISEFSNHPNLENL
ncbi:MAG: serine/threonine-protein kinase, partial [Verrucomicrobiota bacterium]